MIKIIVFSDPRAIKCNHRVIYSGQSELWLHQPAGCVWGEGARGWGSFPGRGTDHGPLRWVLGAVPTHPHSHLDTGLGCRDTPDVGVTPGSAPKHHKGRSSH